MLPCLSCLVITVPNTIKYWELFAQSWIKPLTGRKPFPQFMWSPAIVPLKPFLVSTRHLTLAIQGENGHHGNCKTRTESISHFIVALEKNAGGYSPAIRKAITRVLPTLKDHPRWCPFNLKGVTKCQVAVNASQLSPSCIMANSLDYLLDVVIKE